MKPPFQIDIKSYLSPNGRPENEFCKVLSQVADGCREFVCKDMATNQITRMHGWRDELKVGDYFYQTYDQAKPVTIDQVISAIEDQP